MILFFTVLGSVITLFLGFLVLLHGQKSVSNRIFFFQTVATVLWSVTNYLSIVAYPDLKLFWIRMALFFAVPHVFALVFFLLNFPNAGFIIKKKIFYPLTAWMLVLMVPLSKNFSN